MMILVFCLVLVKYNLHMCPRNWSSNLPIKITVGIVALGLRVAFYYSVGVEEREKHVKRSLHYRKEE